MHQNQMMRPQVMPQAGYQDMLASALMGQNRPPQGGMVGGPGPAVMQQPNQMQNMLGAVQAAGGMSPQQAPRQTMAQMMGAPAANPNGYNMTGNRTPQRVQGVPVPAGPKVPWSGMAPQTPQLQQRIDPSLMGMVGNRR